MIVMGVDPGKARTGLAVSDKGMRFAFPKEVITEYDPDRLAETIAQRAREWQVERIVVGLPKNMDGSLGERARECSALAALIREKTGLQTVLYDERCTTMAAYAALDQAGRYGKKRRAVVDAVAAVMILENYLDRLHNDPDETP